MKSSHLLLLCGPFGFCANAGGASQCRNPAHLSGQQQVLCAPADGRKRLEAEWRSAPTCFSGNWRTYCAHTVSNYRNGHGLSVIGTPEAAQEVFEAREQSLDDDEDGLGNAALYSDLARPSHEDIYEVQRIRGKGMGLIAKKDIQRGEIIMLDPAAILSSTQYPLHITSSEGIELLESAARMLPEEDHKTILALDKPSGATGVDAILKTNSFSCQFRDGGVKDLYSCLFPQVSRINHACQPNANAKFIARTLSMEIRATKNITTGQEITISYGKANLKYAERQKLYKENWGFKCSCNLCASGIYKLAESDWRRDRFGQLHKQLEALDAETYDAERVIQWEKEILEISETEGLEVLITEDLERMAYIYSGLGKRSEARVWGQKAKENLLQWTLGPRDTNSDLQRIEELLIELDRA